jgi:hypothetical protein
MALKKQLLKKLPDPTFLLVAVLAYFLFVYFAMGMHFDPANRVYFWMCITFGAMVAAFSFGHRDGLFSWSFALTSLLALACSAGIYMYS